MIHPAFDIDFLGLENCAFATRTASVFLGRFDKGRVAENFGHLCVWKALFETDFAVELLIWSLVVVVNG